MSQFHTNDNEEWEKSFQEIFLRTKSNLEQVNQRYGYSSPDKLAETIGSHERSSFRPELRETQRSRSSVKKEKHKAPLSERSSITIDSMEWQAILDRLQRLETKVQLQELKHQGEDAMQQLNVRCHYLETQLNILTNELEKQRMMMSARDKWTEVLEDIQGIVNKNRSGIMKMEHAIQDLEAWQDIVDKQIQKLNKTSLTSKGSEEINWKEDFNSFKERIETLLNSKISSSSTLLQDKIEANVQSTDRKISSLRQQINNRNITSPSSPHSKHNGEDTSYLPSPDKFDRETSSAYYGYSQNEKHTPVNESSLANLEVIVRGSVAKEVREVESMLETKLETRIQSSVVSKLHNMERDFKSTIENTLRHFASSIGLQTIDDISSDNSASRYFDFQDRSTSSLGSSPLLLRVKPAVKASWEAEIKILSGSVHDLAATMGQHDKHVHDLEVDLKVEMREFKRALEDIRGQEDRATQGLESLYGKLERYEGERKVWEDRLAQEVEIMQRDILSQYRELSTRALDEIIPLEKRLLIVERIAHDALEKIKGGSSMIESAFSGTSFFKKYEMTSQALSQIQQNTIPSLQKEIRDLSERIFVDSKNHLLKEDLVSNIQTSVDQLESYAHTTIPQLETSCRTIEQNISSHNLSLMKLEANMVTILSEMTEIEANMKKFTIQTNAAIKSLQTVENHAQNNSDRTEDIRQNLSNLQIEVAEVQRLVSDIQTGMKESAVSSTSTLSKITSKMEHLQVEVNFSTDDLKRSVHELQQQYATIDMQNHLIHQQLQLLQSRESSDETVNKANFDKSDAKKSPKSIDGDEQNYNLGHTGLTSMIPDNISSASDEGIADQNTEADDQGFNFDNVYYVNDSNRAASPVVQLTAPVMVNSLFQKSSPHMSNLPHKTSPSKPTMPARRSTMMAAAPSVSPLAPPSSSEGYGFNSHSSGDINPISRRRNLSGNNFSSIEPASATTSPFMKDTENSMKYHVEPFSPMASPKATITVPFSSIEPSIPNIVSDRKFPFTEGQDVDKVAFSNPGFKLENREDHALEDATSVSQKTDIGDEEYRAFHNNHLHSAISDTIKPFEMSVEDDMKQSLWVEITASKDILVSEDKYSTVQNEENSTKFSMKAKNIGFDDNSTRTLLQKEPKESEILPSHHQAVNAPDITNLDKDVNFSISKDFDDELTSKNSTTDVNNASKNIVEEKITDSKESKNNDQENPDNAIEKVKQQEIKILIKAETHSKIMDDAISAGISNNDSERPLSVRERAKLREAATASSSSGSGKLRTVSITGSPSTALKAIKSANPQISPSKTEVSDDLSTDKSNKILSSTSAKKIAIPSMLKSPSTSVTSPANKMSSPIPMRRASSDSVSNLSTVSPSILSRKSSPSSTASASQLVAALSSKSIGLTFENPVPIDKNPDENVDQLLISNSSRFSTEIKAFQSNRGSAKVWPPVIDSKITSPQLSRSNSTQKIPVVVEEDKAVKSETFMAENPMRKSSDSIKPNDNLVPDVDTITEVKVQDQHEDISDSMGNTENEKMILPLIDKYMISDPATSKETGDEVTEESHSSFLISNLEKSFDDASKVDEDNNNNYTLDLTELVDSKGTSSGDADNFQSVNESISNTTINDFNSLSNMEQQNASDKIDPSEIDTSKAPPIDESFSKNSREVSPADTTEKIDDIPLIQPTTAPISIVSENSQATIDPSTLTVKERLKLRQDSILRTKNTSTFTTPNKPITNTLKINNQPATTDVNSKQDTFSKRNSVLNLEERRGSVAAMAAKFTSQSQSSSTSSSPNKIVPTGKSTSIPAKQNFLSKKSGETGEKSEYGNET